MAGVLRGLPRALAATAPVAFALRAWAALRAGDWAAVLRLHAAGDRAQRALLAPRLRQARPGLPTLHATLGAFSLPLNTQDVLRALLRLHSTDMDTCGRPCLPLEGGCPPYDSVRRRAGAHLRDVRARRGLPTGPRGQRRRRPPGPALRGVRGRPAAAGW
jgi:hypothetical protein